MGTRLHMLLGRSSAASGAPPRAALPQATSPTRPRCSTALRLRTRPTSTPPSSMSTRSPTERSRCCAPARACVTAALPVVCWAARSTVEIRVKAFAAGADDWVAARRRPRTSCSPASAGAVAARRIDALLSETERLYELSLTDGLTPDREPPLLPGPPARRVPPGPALRRPARTDPARPRPLQGRQRRSRAPRRRSGAQRRRGRLQKRSARPTSSPATAEKSSPSSCRRPSSPGR